MKKNILQCLSVIFVTLLITQPVTALAASYSFSSEDETGFGKTSSIDRDDLINSTPENVRRNKDVTYYPPEYGVFSGEISTDQTSLYHALPEMNISDSNTIKGGSASSTLQLPELTGEPLYTSTKELPETSGVLPSTSTNETLQTLPWQYADGSIGTLSGSKLGLVKVYEGETNESMRKGAGHFAYTSTWDGNAAFAAHNRGSSAYFAGIKDLAKGDKITYTTQYGKRIYQVFLKVKITDTDTSYLSWSDENIITMITCVANEPSYRWCVQAREMR